MFKSKQTFNNYDTCLLWIVWRKQRLIRIHKSKDRQDNDQKKKTTTKGQTTIISRNVTHETSERVTRSPL
jgi:hypothetical protein